MRLFWSRNMHGNGMFGFEGCNAEQQKWIKGAFKDVNEMVSASRVQNIKWDSRAASEYLGSPDSNTNQRTQIQTVFKNIALVTLSLLATPLSVRVRCDDPEGQCSGPCSLPYNGSCDLFSEP